MYSSTAMSRRTLREEPRPRAEDQDPLGAGPISPRILANAVRKAGRHGLPTALSMAQRRAVSSSRWSTVVKMSPF